MMRQKLFLAVAGLLLCLPLFAKERIVLGYWDYGDWWTRDDRSLNYYFQPILSINVSLKFVSKGVNSI